MRTATIAQKIISDQEPVFITLELGPTHMGLESAKRMIKAAAEAKADAVKFQILDADRLVKDEDMMVTYGYLADRDTGEVRQHTESLRDVLRRRSFARDEWKDLKAYADEQGILFFATISYEEEVDLIVEMGCPSIKIASLDVNHLPLLRRVAKEDLCIQLDTGNATIGEIEQAVDLLLEEGNENVLIHHCPSGYPARLESINLRIIPTLKQIFGEAIAFSDHTAGWDMDIAAVALGANLIEKTITEDRTQISPEHVMSLELDEIEEFVSAIRQLEVAMGTKRRILTRTEAEMRTKRRRSVFLAENGKKGQKVLDLKIDFSRPGQGISPADFEGIANFSLRRDLPAGHLLQMTDLISE